MSKMTDVNRSADPAEVRAQARRQWSEEPAGAIAGRDYEPGSRAWFAAVESYRYHEQSWMHETFDFEGFRDRQVLEIGVGLGTDHMQFARAGAQMTGIDLTPRSVELTRRRCELEGVESDLRIMDAEQLEFSSQSFDVVYSFGVLHHVASPERAFREVRRVLRPGGVFIGALYSRESLFWWRLLLGRWISLAFLREPIEDLLARIEYGADEACPSVRLFSREELRRALQAANFPTVALKRRHVGLGRLTPYLPVRVERSIGRRVGWYLVHEAR